MRQSKRSRGASTASALGLPRTTTIAAISCHRWQLAACAPRRRGAVQRRKGAERAPHCAPRRLWPLASLAGFPVELLPRKRRSPVQERCPYAEPAGAGGVVDEVAYKSLDPRAFEQENHGFFGEKDAVSPKASPVDSVRRALCEDRPCSLARAWLERGNDRDALIRVASIRRLYTLGLVGGSVIGWLRTPWGRQDLSALCSCTLPATSEQVPP